MTFDCSGFDPIRIGYRNRAGKLVVETPGISEPAQSDVIKSTGHSFQPVKWFKSLPDGRMVEDTPETQLAADRIDQMTFRYDFDPFWYRMLHMIGYFDHRRYRGWQK